MAKGKRQLNSSVTKGKAGALGFEAPLWFAAEKLRSNVDAAEHQDDDLIAAKLMEAK